MTEVCTDGAHYGSLKVDKNAVKFSSIDDKEIFNVKLDHISQCVVPQNNRDEVEIHFHEEDIAKDEDALVQITFHFPTHELAEDEEIEETKAEEFKRNVFETGVIKSVTGNVIVEFSKEQGNFVTPRGKYSIQMLASAMHMQGGQYSYRIKYEDIVSLFLLPKPDGQRMAFVISLDKPIRQGNQKYQHLIVETHKIETTISVNLTNEEMEKYEGQLTAEMTAPLSTLFAKIFKVLSQTTVFVPKHFTSARETNAVKCSLKTNEGLLYPLAKSFIFIHKPTVIIKFEDVESVEFQRYDPNAVSGLRNFDLVVTLKASATSDAREYSFATIDRAEYTALHDFIEARNLKIIEQKVTRPSMAEFEGDEEEDESEDDDYVGGQSDHSDDDSDASDEEDGEEDKVDENDKKRKLKTSSKSANKKSKTDENND